MLTKRSVRDYNDIGMRYFKLSNDEFVQNGASTVRVGHVITMEDPVRKARTVKVFEVLQCIRENPSNPSPPVGAMILLSFPNEQANSTDYTWDRSDPAQLPFEIRDKAANLAAAAQRRN